MKLYNTLTRKTEEFKPLNPPQATVYTCGPTVYDYSHIGHWFTYVRWDTLIRTLKASGFEPKWVVNITDVGHLVSDADEGEDKLEKGARREGKSAWDVAKFYTEDFLDNMRQLNILTPDEMPRATEHIQEQIELIQKLEKAGYTYTTSDGVYYDTSAFPTYADFAKLDLEEQQEGARVEANPEKRNPTDFALWKFSPKDHKRDMEWESPWGRGFPGWHIECSAMSMKYLGETLDIHTGGIDHIPVHHSNEIAQSEAVTGKPFANMWLHSNHVTANSEKISKSLGNGIRLPEIVDRGYLPEVLRLHILESHYRSQSKFSWESLAAAKNRLKSYERMADLQFQPVESDVWFAADQSVKFILEALQDDLNTPEALAILSALASRTEEQLISSTEIDQFYDALKQLDELFGLNLSKRQDITGEQKALIAQREEVRGAKDWTRSDELRRILTDQGIGVRDTAYGPIWYRL
ncbi:MAG TPA: cysteine--tRNA ligase [Candidatus Saccharimonadales bacterium]